MKRLVSVLLAVLIAGMFVWSCSDTTSTEPRPPPDDQTVLGEKTVILDEVSSNAISQYDSSGTITFASSNAQISNLDVGSIVISTPCASAPFGFLRYVDSKIVTKEGVVLTTSETTLEDAYEELHISHSKKLTTADWAGGYNVDSV